MLRSQIKSLKLFPALFVLLGVLALGGCGVKGDLERPPAPGQEGVKEKKPSPPPDLDKPFILDWLL